MAKIVTWIKDHKVEFGVLFLILTIGAFFRLYKISEYMTFLGDEGRDVLVVRRLLKFGDLIFVGPGTSVGNIYLGPLYYYLMAPFLLIYNYSPVGPAVMVALFGVATIYLVWLVAYKWTGSKQISLMTAALYAIAPVVIDLSRTSWNPNIMPFFALLTIYSLWKTWQEKSFVWEVITGLSFAFVVQSHYLGLILLPVIFVFLLATLVKNSKSIKYALLGKLIFLLLFVPLILFDWKYNWRNLRAISAFFFSNQGNVSLKLLPFIQKAWVVWETAITRLLAGTNFIFGLILAIAIPLITLTRLNLVKKNSLLFAWLGIGILGLAVYRGPLYDHYLGFMFPAPFILLAILAKNINKYVVYVVFVLLIGINLLNNPLRYAPNRQLQRSMAVAAKIKQEAGNSNFNYAIIADQNYEGAYQYFLELWNAPLVQIDPQRYKETVAQQLFVVCEYPKEKCQPTSNPKAQVANFGWSKIDAVWEVDGVYIYKLIHNNP